MIVGFYFKKISIERKEPVKGTIKVNTKTNIKNIAKQEIKTKTEDRQALQIDFDFTIIYEPKLAEINIGGYLVYLTDSKEAKEIFDLWKKKQLPENVKITVLNTIMNKCNLKALSLEEDTGLPSHIPLPKFISKGEQEKNKTATKTGSYTG